MANTSISIRSLRHSVLAGIRSLRHSERFSFRVHLSPSHRQQFMAL